MKLRYDLDFWVSTNRYIRQYLWERRILLCNNFFWGFYKDLLIKEIGNIIEVPCVECESQCSTLLDYDITYGLFSGGLDSIYLYYKYEYPLISIDSLTWLHNKIPFTYVPAIWVGFAEGGIPLELLRYGIGKVVVSELETGVPSSDGFTNVYPDLTDSFRKYWFMYSGQSIKLETFGVFREDGVFDLYNNAKDLYDLYCGCLTANNDGVWCGNCIKCLREYLIYEALNIQPKFNMKQNFNIVFDSFSSVVDFKKVLKRLIINKNFNYNKSKISKYLKNILLLNETGC